MPAGAGANPYLPFIEATHAAAERERRMLLAWAEGWRASQAVVRALRQSDAQTVALFEDALRQLKGASATATVEAPPHLPAPRKQPAAPRPPRPSPRLASKASGTR